MTLQEPSLRAHFLRKTLSHSQLATFPDIIPPGSSPRHNAGMQGGE